jgi:anti-sigma-K factor RskA
MSDEQLRTREHNARARAMSERRRSGWRAVVFFTALVTTLAVVAVLAPAALDGNAPAVAVVLSIVSILGLAALAHRG